MNIPTLGVMKNISFSSPLFSECFLNQHSESQNAKVKKKKKQDKQEINLKKKKKK